MSDNIREMLHDISEVTTFAVLQFLQFLLSHFQKVMFLNGEDSDQLHWQHVMVTGHDIDTDADNCDGIT